MFEVMDRGDLMGAYEVRDTGRHKAQVAVFLGPEARERAYAYAQWMNAVAGRQRRWDDPGFSGGTGLSAGDAAGPPGRPQPRGR